MEKFTDEELRKELEKRGYYTQNLWTIKDVQDKVKCDDNTAQQILDKALTNEATMDQIWFSIIEFGVIIIGETIIKKIKERDSNLKTIFK
jgi:hypothetical protein